MSDTNENLTQGAAEATTLNNGQAEGAEGSVQGNQESSQQTNDLILGKFKSQDELVKAYQNLEKLASRKTVDPAAFGLTNKQQAQAEQGQQVQATQTQQSQVRQEVQQASPNSQLGQWIKQVTAMGYSTEDAVAMLADHRAKLAAQEVMKQVLEPVTTHQNTLTIKSVTQGLAEEYEDFQDHAEAIGKYLEAHPGIKAAIVSKDTDEETKRYHLENAYLRVAKAAKKSGENAAKVAGSVDAKRQEQMKSASVTGGSGAGNRNQGASTLEDAWEKAAQAYEKGRRLF